MQDYKMRELSEDELHIVNGAMSVGEGIAAIGGVIGIAAVAPIVGTTVVIAGLAGMIGIAAVDIATSLTTP
ncbi:hypothetical protein Q4520_19640 [Alteromonas sp. 1_MG-2023]|uniref:hypothetical protein n=1 Tax=Alteromonas sp. 1_MG-2023 TaxID=3062669 RepID=UPI002689B67B|nr:hypothetical protein [Alteromonas sp. 1_MG-2023]MDO6477642.1 hypothetical protein [Alteromonas sp. 1_MG-2023]